MAQSKSKATFNLEDFNKLKDEMKKAYTNAKEDYEVKKANGFEPQKQSLGKKIVGIIILIAIILLVGLVLVLNFELLFLPKNSVTFVVSDQNGEVIDGLSLRVESSVHTFFVEFDEFSTINITGLGVKPGEYTVFFENIPENYDCIKIMDQFTMTDGGKLKLKYECTKESE